MNYDSNKHVIEYIEGNKVKQFKVPKDDYNLKFDKMSYNDVIMYIKLTKEEQETNQKNDEQSVIKYKPLKTAFAKTKDYFAQDIKLMTQAEKLRKVAEYLVSNNIQELKEFLSNDVFSDDPIIKSVMELLNNKGYTYDEIKNLMQRKDKVDLYTSEIENCIIKDGNNHYSFKDITFKNTLSDLVNLSKQIGILERYTIYVPVDNRKIDFSNKQNGFTQLKQLLFGKASNFATTEGKQTSVFLSNYITPAVYHNYAGEFILYKNELNGFIMDLKKLNYKNKIDPSKLPLYFYSSFNDKIYINLRILYYLLQFNESFKNNNYKFVVEKLKNGITTNVILIAGSAFDLDNILNSLDIAKDDSTDYYTEYRDLMTATISKFFNKQFTPVIQVTSDDEPLYYSDIDQDLTDDEKSEDKTPVKPVENVKPVESVNVPKAPVEDVKPDEDELDGFDEPFSEYKYKKRIERDNKEDANNKNPTYELDGLDDVSNVSFKEDVKSYEDIKDILDKGRKERLKKEKELKKAKGLGLFSFRKDTKETLQSLLNRIVKLESAISYQNEQIKQLKTGIKSINQALPSTIRKDVFGNYFSNSLNGEQSSDSSDSSEELLGGALNPNKVYPKITFSEFRKLYNKL